MVIYDGMFNSLSITISGRKGVIVLLKVQVGKTEAVDSAYRRLMKKVVKGGVIAEVKRRKRFESRSDCKKRRKKATIRKERKRMGLPV